MKALGLLDLCRNAELNLGYWLSPYGMQLPDSLGSLIYHEKAAQASTSYQPDLIPGLLQTADYARARIAHERWRSPEDIEHCVRIRLERQRILRTPHRAPSRFYLNEAALRLEVGSPAITKKFVSRSTVVV